MKNKKCIDCSFNLPFCPIKTGKECLCIDISDTGCGIPLENQKKIFDPFFTTRENGKGTGLGLAVVNSIIEKHKGRISVVSEFAKDQCPGGTTFSIFFPTIESKVHKEPLKELRLEKKTAHILITEEDAKELGIRKHLNKPINSTTLFQTIGKCLKTSTTEHN